MPGHRYTQQELREMSREDFDRAEANNFERPQPAAGLNLGNSVPPPAVLKAPVPRSDVWASNASVGKDFVCPSGQTCRLRKVDPERLMEVGILDQVSRLEGLANELVERAEGQPPAMKKIPSGKDMQTLLNTINLVVTLAVEQPVVCLNDDEEASEGAIRVRQVDLADRMAIVEEALKGLRLLDAFRNP